MAGEGSATSAHSFSERKTNGEPHALPCKSGGSKSPLHNLSFFDEPHFTVAGVTDTTSLGGHGSDVIVRNREALASATASLKKERPDNTDDEAAHHHSLADARENGRSSGAVREYQRAAELNPSEPNLFDWERNY